MRNLFLSMALVAFGIGIFVAGYSTLVPGESFPQPATSKAPGLGDMTPFASIVTDVQAMSASGDLPGARTRIKDLETAWDDAEPTLRPVDPVLWGNVDAAIDDALRTLRTGTIDPRKVAATLASLQAALADPTLGQSPTSGGLATSATTDANGHALPCETLLQELRDLSASATLTDDERGAIEALQAQGIERCNADDDAHADAFFATAIALVSGKKPQ